MNTVTDTPTKGRMKTEYVGPEGPSIYANSTEMGISAWDVRIKLGEIVGLGEEPNSIAAKHIATVLMAPAHAKAFYEALGGTLKLYEEKFGEIDLERIRGAAIAP